MKKPKRAKWYYIYTAWCPACGQTTTDREAKYTERPKDDADRYEYHDIYDDCMG